MIDKDAIRAYVRQELRRRLKPSLLRMATLGGDDLTEVFVDIIATMTEKDPHEQF